MAIRWVLVFIIILSGCIATPNGSEPGETANTKEAVEGPQEPSHVPTAPLQFYLHPGDTKAFTFMDLEIEVTYISAQPKQLVRVKANDEERLIEVDLDDTPTGISWKINDVSFELKPVIWETRDGQEIPFYERTWNTTELYFEVNG